MSGRQFAGDAERLLSPQRLALLEPERVVDLCLQGVTSALDVGTGVGLFAGIFQARGLEPVAGVDLRPDLLALARQRVEGAEFREAAAESLPWDDLSFDLVFLGHVLHETEDPVLALQEAARVARIRLAVLEWPAEPTNVGPPPDHRLSETQIAGLARQAGLNPPRLEFLHSMRLYLWD